MLISCGNVVIFDRFPQVIAYYWANIKKNLSPIDHSVGKVDTIIVINKKQQIIHDSLLLMHSLYHQHNSSFCLDKHIGIATNYRINLVGCNWLSILTDMQLLAVNHFRNLFSSHPSVLTCEAIKYSFFDFHLFFIISSQISLYLGDLADYNHKSILFFQNFMSYTLCFLLISSHKIR